jgi:hypothetical protein
MYIPLMGVIARIMTRPEKPVSCTGFILYDIIVAMQCPFDPPFLPDALGTIGMDDSM